MDGLNIKFYTDHAKNRGLSGYFEPIIYIQQFLMDSMKLIISQKFGKISSNLFLPQHSRRRLHTHHHQPLHPDTVDIHQLGPSCLIQLP